LPGEQVVEGAACLRRVEAPSAIPAEEVLVRIGKIVASPASVEDGVRPLGRIRIELEAGGRSVGPVSGRQILTIVIGVEFE
jgi:hypothetical protein